MGKRYFRLGAAVAMVVTLLVLPINQAAAADCGGIEARIVAAKTAADHDAIAVCYDEMARAATARSAEHLKMKESYKTLGGMAAKHSLPEHCDSFAASFAAEAKLYSQMAASHREMAKGVK